jgi:hypothetical protein
MERRIINRKLTVGVAIAIVILLGTVAQLQAVWWNPTWKNKKPIIVTERSGSTLTNYQLKLVVDYEEEMQSDFDDLRFTYYDGTTETWISHWVETYFTNTNATVWVRVPSIPAGGMSTLYMYYGNSGATGASDFSSTFTKDYGESGQAGLWHMDEGSGTTTADVSGNANTGTLENGPVWQISDGGQWDGRSDVKFSTGSNLYFDGVNDYVSVPHSTSVNIAGDLSIEMWINPQMASFTLTGPHPGLGLVSKRTTNSPGPYMLVLHSGGTDRGSISLYGYYTGIGDYRSASTSSTPVVLNQWQHIAVTRTIVGNVVSVSIYYNGASQSINYQSDPYNWGAATTSNTEKLWLVREPYFAAYTNEGTFKGLVDEVRVYNRALSAGEIRSHYERRKYASVEPTYSFGKESQKPRLIGLDGGKWVSIGDYDNDGLNDIAVAEYGANKVTVFKNDGITIIKQWTGLSRPIGVDIGDYDNDGYNDVAFGEHDAGRVTAYKSDGVTMIKQWTGLSMPYGVAVGDYDNNGLNDIAMAEWGAGRVRVYQSDGVTVIKQWTGLVNPVGVDIGDYDNDGLNDIAFTEYNAGRVWVYKSDGTTVIKQWTGLSYPYGVTIGDYDNDGLDDIVIHEGGSKVTVYKSDGTTVIKRWTLDAQTSSIGDYDNDGLNDIAIMYYDKVNLYLCRLPGSYRQTIVTLRGTLTNSTGYPIQSGSIRVTIKDSFGAQVWQDTFNNIIDNGRYNIPLGTQTPLKLIKGQIYNAILEVDAESLTFVAVDVTFGDNNPAGDIIQFVAD